MITMMDVDDNGSPQADSTAQVYWFGSRIGGRLAHCVCIHESN